MHDEVHASCRRLAHLDVELDVLAVEAVEQDLREPLADGRVVAVTRQVAEHRDVAAVGLAAHEHPQLAAADGLQHALGHLGELLGRGVEDLVARVGLEGVHQALARVAARLDADPGQHLGGLLAQQRDAGDGLRVRRTRQQAEEPALAADLAVLVEGLHADVVEVRRPVHGGARVGLRQHQEGLLAGLGLGGIRQLGERLRLVLVGPEDAQPGAGHRAQDLVVALALEVVLPVAEEREVVVGQPGQEGPAAVQLLRVERRGRGGQLLDDLAGLGAHLLPVLDGVADLAEHLLEGLLDLAGVLVGAEPADLDVHPGLADRAVDGGLRLVLDRVHALEDAGDVADHVELRMDDQVDLALLPGQLHRHRVDEEGHVVGDDLDHRVTDGRPPVVGVARGEHVHVGPTLRTVVGEPELRRQGGVQVDVGPLGEVVGGDVAVVGPDELPDLVGRGAARALAGHRELGGPSRAARTSSGRSPLTRHDSTTPGAVTGGGGQPSPGWGP